VFLASAKSPTPDAYDTLKAIKVASEHKVKITEASDIWGLEVTEIFRVHSLAGPI
jgi:hypothetical protein